MSMSEEQLLRLELERSLARYEGAGMTDEAKATKARLAKLPTVEAPAEAPEAEDFGTGNYEDRTVAQLKALAESKGLSTSGSKADLIDTLREA